MTGGLPVCLVVTLGFIRKAVLPSSEYRRREGMHRRVPRHSELSAFGLAMFQSFPDGGLSGLLTGSRSSCSAAQPGPCRSCLWGPLQAGGASAAAGHGRDREGIPGRSGPGTPGPGENPEPTRTGHTGTGRESQAEPDRTHRDRDGRGTPQAPRCCPQTFP